MRKFLFLLLTLSSTVQFLQAQNNEASLLNPLITQYQADATLLNRKYTLKQTQEYYLRMDNFYKTWLNQLKALPFAKLSVNERVDYLLLKRDINADAAATQKEANTFNANSFSIPFALTIVNFENQRRVGKQLRGDITAQNFAKLKAEIENTSNAVNNLQLTLSPAQANWALETTKQYEKVFSEAYKFYDGYDPDFTSQTKNNYLEAAKALKDYAAVLSKTAKLAISKDDGSGIIGNPIGNNAFLGLLKDEMIAYTPAQIEAIAMREFAWCDAEMLKAAKEIGFGNDWKAALEKVKTAYQPLGKQPEFVYQLANEAIDFAEKNKLIVVPNLAKEGWRMRMLSPEEQKFAPFFLGGESVLIAYPTTDMSEEAKQMTLRGNNRHFSRAVVFHELIPGHNLQYYMQNRYKTYRKDFSTPFWSEGWALYWEMLLWDNNFAKTPEDKIGMLFWRMHRCARIIFSMNYHLGKWKPQQCINFIVDRVGFERANAEAEVRRSFTGGYGPLYQIGYMLGGLQFRALHKELVASGKLTNIQFHDRILKENNMPVEMVRAILTQQLLPENYTAKWKFAGEIK